MSSTVDLVVAAVFLAGACIFLAHAIEAYRRLKKRGPKLGTATIEDPPAVI